MEQSAKHIEKMPKEIKKFIFFIFGGLIIFNILAWLAVGELAKPHFLEVNFFDVGQGDAIFIEDPHGHQILIDGGSTSTVLGKLAKEMPFWDKSLDLIVLTHPERDHMAGLIEVLKRYRIDYILWTGVIRDTSEYKAWREEIAKEKAVIKIAKAGQKVKLGKNTELDILYPLEKLEGQEAKNSNDTSIVSRLVFNQDSFLFTGDADKSVEENLLAENVEIDSDVLKVGHHGSKTSTTEKFVAEVSPEFAIIPVGKKNTYGHPTNEVLERLKKYDTKILRTDLNGDIKIISDGKNLKLITNNL